MFSKLMEYKIILILGSVGMLSIILGFTIFFSTKKGIEFQNIIQEIKYNKGAIEKKDTPFGRIVLDSIKKTNVGIDAGSFILMNGYNSKTIFSEYEPNFKISTLMGDIVNNNMNNKKLLLLFKDKVKFEPSEEKFSKYYDNRIISGVVDISGKEFKTVDSGIKMYEELGMYGIGTFDTEKEINNYIDQYGLGTVSTFKDLDGKYFFLKNVDNFSE